MTTQAMAAGGGGLRLDGRYQLITEIGSGGMSVVWCALDEVLGRHVAVKVLTVSLAAGPQSRRRLLAEARAVAALSHPHITGVHDFGVHRAGDGQATPYLVMELLTGDLLSDALRRGPLPWQQAVTVCAELASALQAAHRLGIVHRDVTPANVMLTSTGVKVLDFGISALIGETQSAERREVFGTAAYLAPERLVSGQITASADVYAAGLVLYQCLAGRLPWLADSITEMLYAHAHLEPHPLPLLGLPRAIEEICLQCLSREPRHRPSSAELAQILSREVHRTEMATIRLGEYDARTLACDGATMTLPLAAPRRRHAGARRVLAGATALVSALGLGYTVRAAGPQLAVAQAQDVTMMVPCSVNYAMSPTSDGQFEAMLTVTNTTGAPVPQWIVAFSRPRGQSISSTRTGQAAQQVVVSSAVVHVSQQGQTVTVTSLSALDAGASVTHTLHGQYSGQPAGVPEAFTLNGRRCDATIILAAATPAPGVTAAPPAAVAQVATWDKPPGKSEPKGRTSNGQTPNAPNQTDRRTLPWATPHEWQAMPDVFVGMPLVSDNPRMGQDRGYGYWYRHIPHRAWRDPYFRRRLEHRRAGRTSGRLDSHGCRCRRADPVLLFLEPAPRTAGRCRRQATPGP